MSDHLAHADLLLLLADVLRRPSEWASTEGCPDMPTVEALAHRTGVSGDVMRRLVDEWGTAEPVATAAEYSRLFDGAQACPPNETVYIRRDKGAILADIAGFHRAFGFELAGSFGDKHDHILSELQFTALLLVLIDRAEDDERRRIAKSAAEAFLRDHLGAWIGAFAARLAVATASPFYAAVARATTAAWEALRAAYDLQELDASPDLPVLKSSGTPYECDM